MSRIRLTLAGTLVFLGTVAASGVANAADCTNQTLNNYLVAGFSCTIGDKTFSNFSYAIGTVIDGGSAAPATAINVVPLGSPNWGFDFDGIWLAPNTSASGGGISGIDAALGYTVRVTSGAALINSAELDILATLNGTGGLATTTEEICAGALLSACPSLGLHTLDAAIPGTNPASITFAPVSVVDISKDIAARGGSGFSADVSVVTNTVDQVPAPEPASLALLGSSLIGLGLLRLRRRVR